MNFTLDAGLAARLSRLGVRALPSLALLAAVALVLWLAAGWYWALFGERPQVPPPLPAPATAEAARAVAAAHLFGAAGAGAAVPVVSYRLLGVAANSRAVPGFAILAEEGKPPLPVVEGSEIEPGVVLRRVLPDRVEIERQGTMITVRLPEKNAAASGGDPGASPNPGAPGDSPRFPNPASEGRK